VQSPEATTGTRIHEALAKQDPTGLSAQEENVFLSCNDIESSMLVKYFGDEVRTLKKNPVRERRFWVQWPDGLRHSGQIDSVHRWKNKAIIFDYKTLAGDVSDSSRNLQLRDLACLYYANNTVMLDEIATCVIQPMVTHSPEIAVYNKEDIRRSMELMYFRVSSSNSKNAPRVAGAVQCKYCKAKGGCEEYQKFSTALVSMPERSLLNIPVNEWTPAQRRQFCDGFSVAQKWLEDAWTAMEKGALSDPSFVPGYAMSEGSTRTKIKNLQSVFDRFSKSGGSLEQFMKHATITNKDLEAITRDATKLKGKALKSAIEQIIGEDFESTQSKPSLKKV